MESDYLISVIQLKEKLTLAILKEMEKQNLSQGEVARMIGLDRRNVNKILRGTERGVSIDQLVRIANGIGLDVDVIIKRSKD
ncbi:MAG: XRE family transcriptional regulator [Halobacteriovoraceae bacterium]|nr:XRE family transcriptional regulator [Halobacteriovoraceae bacterium]